MSITTYTELQTAVENWLNRDDLTARIPEFIALAEARMYRKLRHWRMERRATTTFDQQYEALPNDYLKMIRLDIQTKRQVELASMAEIIENRRLTNNATGEPRLYAISAGQIELWPTPDGSYTGEMVYYAKFDALSASVSSNWVLTYALDLYLYGALLHSAPFLKDDERLQVWGAMYSDAFNELNEETQDQSSSGTGLRMRRRGLG